MSYQCNRCLTSFDYPFQTHTDGDRVACIGELKFIGMNKATEKVVDTVNHPSHYTSHPSGIEAIQVTEHFNFNIGNAIKYLWRTDLKGDAMENLEKSAWYVNREIERRKKAKSG